MYNYEVKDQGKDIKDQKKEMKKTADPELKQLGHSEKAALADRPAGGDSVCDSLRFWKSVV